ncbi:MAG: IclR family transcriptional regulator, partial [Egibacteraceae bacterium]
MESALIPGGVQSVARACAVLRVLSDSAAPLGATEVARRVGLNRTIVYRLLRTLQAEGMVRSVDGRFALAEENLRLGYSYLEGLGFYRSTLAYAVLLCNRFVADRPWVVSIGVPVRDEVLLVDRLWGRHAPLDIILDIGTRLPIDRSALGRAILATRPEREVRALVGDDSFERIAGRLAGVRRSRVSFADGEVQAGVCAIAAPVCDQGGRAMAAVAVSGTDIRAHLQPDSEVAERIRRTAD